MAGAKEVSPTVIIAGDKSKATLRIPPGCDSASLSEPALIGLITDEGVEITDFTNKAIRELIQDPPPEDQERMVDIAFSTPVINGKDGKVEWCIDEDEADDKKEVVKHSSDEVSSVSHYERRLFQMVYAGDTIGILHPAEPGSDGRDVTGATIPARSGKEAQLTFNESILKKADGSLIAQQDGVLYHKDNKAQIRKYIEIKDYVDFSTGNIDFDGDIDVGKGVRDCFEVKATGKIEVRGLIEAATIETGKDLHAHGGFAGRERGYARVGGTLYGKYLDNVHGKIKEDLCVDREVINCSLEIEGKINSPRGAIIGGTVTPTGEVEIGTLGSGAGVETDLVIGLVPALAPFATQLDLILEEVTADYDKLKEEQDIINKNSAKGRMTATDKERQTEILFELASVEAVMDKSKRTYERVCEVINKRRRVNVLVHQKVHPGVTFILDDRRYKMTQELSGPVRFYVDGREFVYRVGDAPNHPVASVADVRANLAGRAAA